MHVYTHGYVYTHISLKHASTSPIVAIPMMRMMTVQQKHQSSLSIAIFLSLHIYTYIYVYIYTYVCMTSHVHACTHIFFHVQRVMHTNSNQKRLNQRRVVHCHFGSRRSAKRKNHQNHLKKNLQKNSVKWENMH